MTEVHYGIDAASRLTGLSQEVLRSWESRYGLVAPSRSRGGRRQYTEADIARLRKCARALDVGYRIGDVARLPDEHIDRLLAALDRPAKDYIASQALNLIARLDQVGFASLLDGRAVALGPYEFCWWCTDLLRLIGEEWECDRLSIASEHWTTVQIKCVLTCLLKFGQNRPVTVPMCFATLPGEHHELGTLMAAVCAQDTGATVSYLGPDLPVDDLIDAVTVTGAGVVAVGATIVPADQASEYIAQLRTGLPRRTDVWVGGAASVEVELPTGVFRIEDSDELRHQVIRTLTRN